MATARDPWSQRLERIKRLAERIGRSRRQRKRLADAVLTRHQAPADRRPPHNRKRENKMPTMPAGSILIGSTRATELGDWYRRIIAPDHTGDGPIVLGELWLIIEQRDDVSETNPEPGRSILNFHVEDFDLHEAQLQAAGVEWIAPAEDRAAGRFATFKDPDGNYLQLIQLKSPSN